MTQYEFAQGWKLLILQPWGWRYRTLTAKGDPSPESEAQLRFYYNKLKWAEAAYWMRAAELFAEGDEWPSVHDLTMSLKLMQAQNQKKLEGPEMQPSEMPEEVRAMLQKIIKGMP